MNDHLSCSRAQAIVSRARFGKADFICAALIAIFGLAAFMFHQRTPDFMGEDAFYGDAARSLLHSGTYAVNGVPETTQPPGLAGILAAVYAAVGYSYSASVQTMAVFEMLGFLVAYELLRRRESRLVAAIICIVLITSPVYFAWATRQVYACFPYFFTTMLALLCFEEYENATTAGIKAIWGSISAVAVAASLAIATSTMALLAALVAAVAATALRSPGHARRRLLHFLPILLIGVMVQVVWTHRKPAPLEWSLPGYPGSYWHQLVVKEGNYPELGMASIGDIPGRVTRNLLGESDILAHLVLRHGVSQTKVAVVIIPVLFLVIGWAWTVWRTKGTGVVEWFFAAYQGVYLLWPWTMEPRFVLPIAPLACFYAWRGINGTILAMKTKPRMVGLLSFPLAVLLGISGVLWMYEHRLDGLGKWPDELLIPIWLIYAVVALWMAWSGRSILATKPFSDLERWLLQPRRVGRVGATSLGHAAGGLVVAGLVLLGVGLEARIARENLATTNVETNAERTEMSALMPAEVEAGTWIREHTTPDSIVMARHWPTVYHFADRKLIWFPPISNSKVLMDGIAKHHVDYIVVIHHSNPYYLPDDDICFDPLLSSHPGSFQLILDKGNIRIFKVVKSDVLSARL